MGVRPVVVEARERVAETIRPTGDGRCNISNSKVHPGDYRNPDFVRRVFLRCHPKQVPAFLGSCGIMLREEAQGRLYPLPNKATAVIEALLRELRKLDVELRCGKRVAFVRRNASAWTLSFEGGGKLRARTLLVCTGGGLGEEFLPRSVEVVPACPILAPLACDAQPLRGLDKIRVKCALTADDVREEGELTFRTYGISGICAFNLSRLVKPGEEISVDFAPTMKHAESLSFLSKRLKQMEPRTWLEFTTGMLLPQVTRVVLRAAGLDEQDVPREGDLAVFERFWHAFPLTVRGIGDRKLAQVQRGGVRVEHLDPHTMEAQGAEALFAAGEAVDVDGPCGGYNLHWAWASGMVAGRAAAQRASKDRAARAEGRAE